MVTTQQPLNPYIAGKAVGGERGFFGRQDILREVERTLTSPDQNALVLFGQRRIGKTSILLQLEHRLPSPPFVPVYFDLMDKARLPLNRVLYELAATAAPLVGVPPLAEAEFRDGDAFRQAFIPTAYEALGEERRLAFLFDEFDVLDVAAEEKLPDTAAARAFFPYLRELMVEELHLGFVFVVGRKTDELSTDFLATFKAARYRRVSVLKPEAARELITLAQLEGSLNFTDEAVERILALTAGHPYFAQLLCQTLFDRAYDAKPEGVPTVDVDDVEASAPDVLEAGNNAFEWVWDGLPPAERIIFSAIATHADEATVLTEDEIMAILQDAGIRILIKELALAPRTLVEWEMLEEANGGYRFFVELMRRWVAEQKRLEQVKDELDRVIPLADTLYQGGSAYYHKDEIESAIVQLRRALQENRNHLKARLLLGTIYREQGQLAEAVAEFEAVYRYDEVEGRYELVHTLLQWGAVLEQRNDWDGALTIYERVLGISPHEEVARERAETLKRQYKLDGLVKEAEQHEQAEEWSEAIAIYEQLLKEDPNNTTWQAGLKRTMEQAKLARRYNEALLALERGDLVRARDLLAQVIASKPTYKEAPRYLLMAVEGVDSEDLQSRLEREKRQLAKERRKLWLVGAAAIIIISLLSSWFVYGPYQWGQLQLTPVMPTTATETPPSTEPIATPTDTPTPLPAAIPTATPTLPEALAVAVLSNPLQYSLCMFATLALLLCILWMVLRRKKERRQESEHRDDYLHRDHLRRLLDLVRKDLWRLEERKARYGPNPPLELLNEIDVVRKEIAGLERELGRSNWAYDYLKRLIELERKNLWRLEERKARYGPNPPLELLNEIDVVRKEIARLEKDLERGGLTRDHLKRLLELERKNLWRLEERKARYGPNPPLELLNEIDVVRKEVGRLEGELRRGNGT